MKGGSIFAGPAVLWVRTSLALAFLGACYAIAPGDASPTAHFFLRDDLPTLLLLAIVLYALARGWGGGLSLGPFSARRAMVFTGLAAVICAVLGGLGKQLLFEGYVISYDEHLFDFDAQIFRHGELMARLPEAWRAYMPALEYLDVIRTPGYEYWSSAYLPTSAAFRALAETVGLKDWVNGIWAAVAVLATFGAARRLWPGRPGLWAAAIALLVTSAQFVLMSMTAYAMPAHLALNMVWLWLFLRDRRGSDLAAIGVGFVACGLHQVAFHPLFVAPFLLENWLAGRRLRAGLFAAAYAVMGLFWIEYPALQAHLIGFAPEAGDPFVRRIVECLQGVNPANLGVMSMNLVRFFTWQSLATVPLLLAGVAMVRRLEPTYRAILLGIAGTLLVVTIIVPGQGAGWGYRYLHGFLGGAALVAVEMYRRLTETLADDRRQLAAGGLAMMVLISALGLLPLRAWQARQFAHPFAAAMRAIETTDADVVVLDTGTVGLEAGAFNRNTPYLTNRPKVLLMANLSPELIAEVCGRGRVAIIDGNSPAMAGVQTWPTHWPDRARELRAEFARLNCGAAVGKY